MLSSDERQASEVEDELRKYISNVTKTFLPLELIVKARNQVSTLADAPVLDVERKDDKDERIALLHDRMVLRPNVANKITGDILSTVEYTANGSVK